jgi:hypothetical protein
MHLPFPLSIQEEFLLVPPLPVVAIINTSFPIVVISEKHEFFEKKRKKFFSYCCSKLFPLLLLQQLLFHTIINIFLKRTKNHFSLKLMFNIAASFPTTIAIVATFTILSLQAFP